MWASTTRFVWTIFFKTAYRKILQLSSSYLCCTHLKFHPIKSPKAFATEFCPLKCHPSLLLSGEKFPARMGPRRLSLFCRCPLSWMEQMEPAIVSQGIWDQETVRLFYVCLNVLSINSELQIAVSLPVCPGDHGVLIRGDGDGVCRDWIQTTPSGYSSSGPDTPHILKMKCVSSFFSFLQLTFVAQVNFYQLQQKS